MCDFSDFLSCRSGCYYYINGVYTEDDKRLCLTEYKSFSSKKLDAIISNSEYRILVRELDAENNFLKSIILKNGDRYEPSHDTKYLAVGIYNMHSEHGMSYEKYRELFSDGFEAKLVGDYIFIEDTLKLGSIENCEFDNIESWRSGVYYYTNGMYTTDEKRLCLNEYKTFNIKKYDVIVSDA